MNLTDDQLRSLRARAENPTVDPLSMRPSEVLALVEEVERSRRPGRTVVACSGCGVRVDECTAERRGPQCFMDAADARRVLSDMLGGGS